jgi:hypothetical protein
VYGVSKYGRYIRPVWVGDPLISGHDNHPWRVDSPSNQGGFPKCEGNLRRIGHDARQSGQDLQDGIPMFKQEVQHI